MQKYLPNYFLLGLIIIAGYGMYKIFAPFLVTLLTAFIFWQIFNATYKKLSCVLKNERIASFVTCMLVILVIILPFFVIGSIAAKEALGLYKNFAYETKNISELQNKIENYFFQNTGQLGITEEKVHEYLTGIDLQEISKKIVGIAANILQGAYQQVSQFILLVFVMLFALYYLFLDGEKFLKYVFRLSPLKNNEESLIWQRFLSVNHATIKGTIIIGIIQGILGGVTFWALGLGSPALWGVVMAIFSVLPLVGPVTIWVPAAIWLFLTGFWIQGIILIIVGSIIIGSVDNFLRPKLVGKDTALHPILVLIGTFGGIIAFGLLGFIIGPLIITIFLALLEILEKKGRGKSNE